AAVKANAAVHHDVAPPALVVVQRLLPDARHLVLDGLGLEQPVSGADEHHREQDSSEADPERHEPGVAAQRRQGVNGLARRRAGGCRSPAWLAARVELAELDDLRSPGERPGRFASLIASLK